MNTSECIEILTNYYTNYTSVLPNYLDKKEWDNFVSSTTGSLRNVYPLTDACLWASDEMRDAYELYGFTF